jgi:hypothetical protein
LNRRIFRAAAQFERVPVRGTMKLDLARIPIAAKRCFREAPRNEDLPRSWRNLRMHPERAGNSEKQRNETWSGLLKVK